jgi:plasmid stability protein
MGDKEMAAKPKRDFDQFIVRLPDGMRSTLAELAARNGRSMTAEVVAALTAYFAKEEAAKQDQLGVEPALRELLANQQATLELLKKMITTAPAATGAAPIDKRLDELLNDIDPQKKPRRA